MLGAYFNTSSVKLASWLIPFGLAVLLAAISNFNFLLFHVLAELFAVIVAILIFVVGWQMYPFTRNHFLMYLGCGYFWVGALDLIHTMTYEQMDIFRVTGANIATQFWIGTRYVEAGLLLTAPWFLNNSLNRMMAFLSFGVVSCALFLLVITGVFPTAFVDGVGLTLFKVVSEYLIMALLAIAVFIFSKQSGSLDKRVSNSIIVSIILTMCAELSFTLYIDVYGLSNVVGHIFKFFSFWLIFMAIVRTTLQEPFEAMYKGASTYDAIPDATIVVDKAGILRQVNNSACKLANMPRKELIGKSDHGIYHPVGTDTKNCPICRAIKRGETIDDLELAIDDSRKIYYSFSISGLHDVSGGHTTVEVIRDVTNKKQAEDEFYSLSKLKDSIVEILPVTLFVKDAKDLRYVEWNKKAEDLTGILKKDLIGKNDFDLWPEEQANLFIEKDREVLNEGSLVDLPEEKVVTKNGKYIMHTKKIPIYNERGEANYLLGIAEDITEKLKTEEKLRHSQKMDALGNLTGGVAHDFNNILGVILGFSELLKDRLNPDDEKQKQYCDEIITAGERAGKLTFKLLEFSRKAASSSETTYINDLVRDMLHMLEKTLTPRIKLIAELEENLWSVSIDRARLEDSILNMCINSMHAMPEGGILTLSTRNARYGDLDTGNMEIGDMDIAPGDYVSLVVSDTGIGMDEEVKQKIFDPFFTTKDAKGTGLGMSQVYGFVQQSQGGIQIFSEPGNGAQIVLNLPRHLESEAVKPEETNSESAQLPSGREIILVVDDEVALLNLSEEILTAYGYTVLRAEGAAQALEILKNNTVDLLLSDVIMPDMDGYQLATEVEKHYPKIKIQMVSGFSEKGDTDASNKALHERRLYKPFYKEELLKRVRELLDRA